MMMSRRQLRRLSTALAPQIFLELPPQPAAFDVSVCVEKDQEIAGLRLDIETAQDSLAGALAEVERLAGELAQASTDRDDARKRTDGLCLTLEEANGLTRRNRERAEKAEADLAKAGARIVELEGELAREKPLADKLEADLDNAHEEIARLKDQIADLEHQLADAPKPAPLPLPMSALPFLKEATPAPADDMAVKQAEATKAFLSGEDISGRPTWGLSPLAARHGPRVTSLDFEGHNPDQIAQDINAGLPRNDHINAGMVKKILAECRKAGVA